MSFMECEKCGGIPGVTACCTDKGTTMPQTQIDEAAERVKYLAAIRKEWDLSPRITDQKIIETFSGGFPVWLLAKRAVLSEAKPVAWVLSEEIEKRETTCNAHLWFSDPQNAAWIALYTAPPAAEAKDIDLSNAKIKAGWHATFSTGNPYCPCDLKTFTKAVNWTLRAIAAEEET